jgi:hypothetical protein
MANFYVGEVLFETGGTIDTPGDITVTAILDCAGSTGTAGQILSSTGTALEWIVASGGASPATPTVAGVLEGYSCGTDGNISVGFGSMALVDPANGGCRNTSLGVCALSNLTFGSGNVAIGSQTLFCATNSGNSIAIGNCALRSSTFSGNVAIGNRAACTVTTGDNNVAIGSGAMQNATTPSLSIAIGCRAMQFGAGSGNIGFGLQALCKVTGSENIAIGTASGSNITTGVNNTFLGGVTGGFISTGSCNIFIGFGAGPTTNSSCCLWIGLDSTPPWLTGDNTSAIKPGAGIIDCAGSCGTAGQVLMSNGANAICWGTAGGASAATPTVAGIVLGCTISNNTALGCNSLVSRTTGNNNTAVGSNALTCNTSGCCNTATGTNALFCNTTGRFNTATGTNTLPNNLLGCRNSAHGLQALFTNTNGNINTANGADALYSNTTGSFNTATGNESLCRNTTGCFNTAAGFCALYSNTVGDCNVAIGNCSGNLVTGSNNVTIGPDVQVATAANSCQLAIGFSATDNWITGTSTKAIKPGAGIIDCAGSCGTAGQVLSSNGSNAIEWITAGGGGGIPDSTLTAKGDLITATAASTPVALPAGTDGQVLYACSTESSGLIWATPQTSPYVTYTTSAVTYTSGTPVLVAVWGGGTIQGTVTLDLVGYGGVNQFWDFYLSGDPTNYNTGWYQYATWPDPSNALSQGTWYVNFPVYPDPNANLWELYFNPAQNSLNASPFTFFYRPLPGSAVPAWQI